MSLEIIFIVFLIWNQMFFYAKKEKRRVSSFLNSVFYAKVFIFREYAHSGFTVCVNLQ